VQEVLPSEIPPDLTDELRRRLDEQSVRSLLEYLAARLGYAVGHARLEFGFTNGSLRQSWPHSGPVRDTELEALALREAPPLA
jgi:hypothetical protein